MSNKITGSSLVARVEDPSDVLFADAWGFEGALPYYFDFYSTLDLASFKREFEKMQEGYTVDIKESVADPELSLVFMTITNEKGERVHASTSHYYTKYRNDPINDICYNYDSMHSYCTVEVGHAFSVIDRKFHHETKHKPGSYGVNVKEVFSVNKTTESLDHHLTTDDFDNVLDELYPSVRIESMVKTYLASDESLLIMVGEPGVGKTCLMKKVLYKAAMLRENTVNSIYVKDVNVLHTPSFWTMLSKVKADFLILDDLDYELLPREYNAEAIKQGEEVKETIVNQLLSFSNGLFPIHTKVLITTNLTEEGIDSALLRPGRCFDVLRFTHLESDYAHNLCTRKFELKSSEFYSVFGEMKKISQAHLMSEVDKIMKASDKNYLNDHSVSVRDYYIAKNSGSIVTDAQKSSGTVQTM